MTTGQQGTQANDGPRRRMGSVGQLDSGRWGVRVRDVDGRRFRLPHGPWDTQEEAEARLHLWIGASHVDRDSAAYRESAAAVQSMTLSAVYAEWLHTTHRSLDDSSDRQTFYRNVISGEAGVWVPQALHGRQTRVRNEWVSPIPGRMLLGNRPINTIRRSTIQQWVISLRDGQHPLKPVTIVKWGRHLNQLFEWAVGEYIDSNPMRGLELFPPGTIRSQRPPPFFLTLPEMIGLTQAAPAEHRLLIEALLWTGMRQGEVRALRKESFRASGSRVWVDKAVHDGKGAPTLGETKTTGSVRLINIPEWVHLALKEAADEAGPGRPIFPGPSGGWMRGDDLNEIFVQVREAAGVLGDPNDDNRGRRKPPTPHDCRATGASLLQATGMHAPIAQGFLGHANAQITLDLYTEIRQFGEEDSLLTDINGGAMTLAAVLDDVYVKAWDRYGDKMHDAYRLPF